VKENASTNPPNEERIHGYTIKQSIVFENDRGFALAENPSAPQPFVTWQLTARAWSMAVSGRGAISCTARPSRKSRWMITSFGPRRAIPTGYGWKDRKRPKRRNPIPVRTDKEDFTMNEKDNCLKNAELSTEQNYNMIDGIPNNIALPVPPAVPLPEVKPLDRVKEPPAKKRSRELER